MNLVDTVIILLLIFFCWAGRRKSFVGETLDFFFFLAAFLLSLRFYALVSNFLESFFRIAHSLSNVFGFFIVWCLVEIVLSLGVRFLLKRQVFLDRMDIRLKKFAFIPAFFRGAVFIAVLLLVMATFPVLPQVKQAVTDSKIGSTVLGGVSALENPLKNVFGGVSQETLTFLTVEPKTNESINLGFKTSDFLVRADLETQMITLVNNERAKRGVPVLSYDEKLRVIAREHSVDMSERGYFSHYSPEGKSVAERAQDQGIDYQVIGENLAYAPSLKLAHSGLMNSPGHRANILSTDYHRIGIGIEDGGVYGLMITQVFAN